MRLRLAGLPLLLPMLWPALPLPPEGEFELLAADIGQGNAVLVRTAHHSLLYDTGPAYGRHGEAGNAGERVLVPLLEMLLDDVESSVDMGMPFSNPENGFHESVMASLRALGRA